MFLDKQNQINFKSKEGEQKKQLEQVPNEIYPVDHITLTHWHERKVRENLFPFGRGIFLFFLNQNIKLFMLFRALSL